MSGLPPAKIYRLHPSVGSEAVDDALDLERQLKAEPRCARRRERQARDTKHKCRSLLHAAVVLPSNSVGTQQIKREAVKNSDVGKNAVTTGKVKNGSLLSLDFKPGQLVAGAPGGTGPQGPQGLKGDKGDPGTNGTNGINGTVRGYARVTATRLSLGFYCVTVPGVNATNGVAVVTPDQTSSETGNGETAHITNGPQFNPCTPNTAFAVTTLDGANVVSDAGFTFIVG